MGQADDLEKGGTAVGVEKMSECLLKVFTEDLMPWPLLSSRFHAQVSYESSTHDATASSPKMSDI